MANKGRSEEGFFGTIHHYDSHGNKVGRSDPGLFGGYTNYDANGRKTGHSNLGLFGSYNHYDSKGNRTGGSDPGIFGSYNHNNTGGCYVATCVYGSYDCPQVWTLRRFRDNTLASTTLGRSFIRTYYAISPTVVKWFGETRWFQKFWRIVLDRLVKELNTRGVQDIPYIDKAW